MLGNTVKEINVNSKSFFIFILKRSIESMNWKMSPGIWYKIGVNKWIKKFQIIVSRYTI